MAVPTMPRSSSGEFQAVLQALRGGEDAAQRRADVFAEDIGHAEMRLAVVQRQTDGLNQGGHEKSPGSDSPLPSGERGWG